MEKKQATIFVYGTLMEGMGNDRIIWDFPRKHERVQVEGYDMYNVGGFPALVHGTGKYFGELITFGETVDRSDLYHRMDRLEGYDQSHPNQSLYIREPITVYKEDGESIETEVYIWNRGVSDLTYIDPKVYSDYRQFHQNFRRQYGNYFG